MGVIWDFPPLLGKVPALLAAPCFTIGHGFFQGALLLSRRHGRCLGTCFVGARGQE